MPIIDRSALGHHVAIPYSELIQALKDVANGIGFAADNTITAAGTYNLTAANAGRPIRIKTPGVVNLVIPVDATALMTDGMSWTIISRQASVVNIVDSAVTQEKDAGISNALAQNGVAQIQKMNEANTYFRVA